MAQIHRKRGRLNAGADRGDQTGAAQRGGVGGGRGVADAQSPGEPAGGVFLGEQQQNVEAGPAEHGGQRVVAARATRPGRRQRQARAGRVGDVQGVAGQIGEEGPAAPVEGGLKHQPTAAQLDLPLPRPVELPDLLLEPGAGRRRGERGGDAVLGHGEGMAGELPLVQILYEGPDGGQDRFEGRVLGTAQQPPRVGSAVVQIADPQRGESRVTCVDALDLGADQGGAGGPYGVQALLEVIAEHIDERGGQARRGQLAQRPGRVGQGAQQPPSPAAVERCVAGQAHPHQGHVQLLQRGRPGREADPGEVGGREADADHYSPRRRRASVSGRA